MADPFSMLKSDHRQVEQLLQQLTESDEGPDREQLVTQLTTALGAHMEYEEANIYPLTADLADEETAEEAETEHMLTREGLTKLAQLVSAPGFGAAVAMLQGGITHHVEEEESEIFPMLRDGLDAERQSELARLLLQAKREAGLLEQSLGQATKDQLVEIADELGLPGTSTMNKEQLKEALSSAIS
jgi:hemerythrin superfamily protein